MIAREPAPRLDRVRQPLRQRRGGRRVLRPRRRRRPALPPLLGQRPAAAGDGRRTAGRRHRGRRAGRGGPRLRGRDPGAASRSRRAPAAPSPRRARCAGSASPTSTAGSGPSTATGTCSSRSSPSGAARDDLPRASQEEPATVGFEPIAMVEVEVGAPLRGLAARPDARREPYRSALALVRLHGAPVGLVRLRLDRRPRRDGAGGGALAGDRRTR